jgi:hypothetical protein
MPDLVAQETSPYGTRRASVLRGRGDTYLYLEDISGPTPQTVSAVWVGNHLQAPRDVSDIADVAPGGAPPRMSAPGTRFPDGCPELDRPELVWFEEGDGVALTDRTGLVAVVPGWGGREGFYGYARNAVGRSALAWELSGQAERMLTEKVADSRQFWRWRLDKRAWTEIRQAGVSHLTARIGAGENEWPIPSIRFPQVVMTQHRYGGESIWITATTGLSAQRMAGVEQYVDEPERAARIELAIARHTPDRSGADLVAALAAVPFGRCTWLGEGHTIGGQAGAYPAFGADRAAVLLTETPPPGTSVAAPNLGGLIRRNDQVIYLWVLLIDDETFRIARGRDSTTALEALRSSGASWIQ